jgi:hypothetical protein
MFFWLVRKPLLALWSGNFWNVLLPGHCTVYSNWTVCKPVLFLNIFSSPGIFWNVLRAGHKTSHGTIFWKLLECSFAWSRNLSWPKKSDSHLTSDIKHLTSHSMTCRPGSMSVRFLHYNKSVGYSNLFGNKYCFNNKNIFCCNNIFL